MAQIILDEGAAPSTPSAGKVAVYAKADGKMYGKDDAGLETVFGGGAGDVVGPGVATNNSLVKFDGTTGKLIKDGAVIGVDVQAYDADLTTWAGITPGANVGAFLATPSSANLIAAVTDETGTGALVFANTPALVTPVLGTPTSGTLTNCTGLPPSTGLSTFVGPALGGTGVANNAAMTVTGVGNYAFTRTLTGVTGVTYPTSGTLATLAGSEAFTNKSYNGMTVTASTGTFTLTNGKTFAVTNTLTLSGTDGTTMTFPTTSATIARSEATNTFTGGQRGTVTTDNDVSYDLAVNNFWFSTPTAGGALTFTNIPTGQGGTILFVNGANYAITAAATTKVTSTFLATISVTGTYLIHYYANGTNVYCSTAGAMA